MDNYPRTMSLAAAVFAAFVATATTDANAADQTQQIAQAMGTPPAAITLPEVVVRPRPQQSWYYDPYTGGHAQRPSSLNHIPFSHYKVPVGYDSMMEMHPYTSSLGPCTEGASPAQGCRHDTGKPISTSHYERPPFNQ
jgi:hypothetical protein